MGQEEGDLGREGTTSEFEDVKGTQEKEEFDKFRDDVELAFPEDTVSYEELIQDDQTPNSGQAEAAVDEHDSTDQLRETTDETQQQHDASTESVSAAESADSMVAQLVAEMEDDRASEEAITQLREQLGVMSPENVEVRLRHLQTQVSDLTAYIDALEEFLDRRGSAKHILESVDRELDSIKSQVATLKRTHKSDHTHVRERIAEIEERLESQEPLQQSLSELDHRTDDLDTRLTDVEESAETVVDRDATFKQDVKSALITFGQRQQSVQDDVEKIQHTHQKLAEAFDTDR